MMGAVFYMLLAGATIPTQRAVIMSSVVFLAIIFDRSPISLRLVSFSAFIVLLFTPESLLSASFQMSFAAVTILVYFYDRSRGFWIDVYNDLNPFKKIFLYFIGVCITTIIASVATAPFSLYHFGQVSFLGSFANLVAVPLLAFFIMPFAILALVCIPLGIEYYPLYIMGIGIDLMLGVARWASSIPYAVIHSSLWNLSAFIALIIAALWGVLWRGYGKVCSLFILCFAFYDLHQKTPDILVSSSSKLTGVYKNQTLYVSSLRSERFTRKNWEIFYGLNEGSAIPLLFKGNERQNYKHHINCGEYGCRLKIQDKKISFVKAAYSQKEECAWADVIISQEPVMDKQHCRSQIIIDKFSTWKNGAHAVYISDDGVSVSHVSKSAGNRPWSIYNN